MILGLPENQPQSSAHQSPKRDDRHSKDTDLQPQAHKAPFWQKHWPPLGWPMFENINAPKAISTRKCPDTGLVHGASYEITLHKSPNGCIIYSMEIQRWSYDRKGEHSISAPVFMRFRECATQQGERLLKRPILEEMRLFGEKQTTHSASDANNFALVSAYLIARIEKGYVPDIKRVLRLYKLI